MSRVAPPIVLAVVLMAGACGGAGDRTANDVDGGGSAQAPAEAVEAMMRAFDEGDCDAAKKVVLTPSQIDCGMVADLEGMLSDDGVALEDIAFTVTESTAEDAIVSIDWNDGEPQETYEVQNVDGEWKVLFDSVA